MSTAHSAASIAFEITSASNVDTTCAPLHVDAPNAAPLPASPGRRLIADWKQSGTRNSIAATRLRRNALAHNTKRSVPDDPKSNSRAKATIRPGEEPVPQTSSTPEVELKQIGPYRLLQLIGEGGMGMVYQAEQREPVRR